MRHNKNFNHLSRTHSHRAAMLSNMACSLIKHKRIFTTLPKAKALRKYVEPLLTKSKITNTLGNSVEDVQKKGVARRLVFSYLNDKEAVTILFGEVASKIKDRPGGYTRIIKTGFRLGDAADTCFIELVDYDENMLSQSQKSKKTSRTRRSSKKKDASEVAAATEDSSVASVDEPKAE